MVTVNKSTYSSNMAVQVFRTNINSSVEYVAMRVGCGTALQSRIDVSTSVNFLLLFGIREHPRRCMASQCA